MRTFVDNNWKASTWYANGIHKGTVKDAIMKSPMVSSSL